MKLNLNGKTSLTKMKSGRSGEMIQAFYKGFRVIDITAFYVNTVEIATTDSQCTRRQWIKPEDIVLVDLPEERMVYSD